MSTLVVACWGRLGDRDRARAAIAHLHETLPEAAVRITGVPSPNLLADKALDEFLNRLGPEKSPSAAGAGDWSTFRGDPARNRAVAARPPFLAPRWSLSASADPRTQLALDRVATAYAQGSGTSLPLLSPLAVGDLLLVRTPRGVAAYDVETGHCRWRHPSDDDGANIGLDRVLWQETAGGAFSADEECVYLVGDARAVDRDAPARSRNVLSAREHFRSREGKLRWQVGGGNGGDEPRLAGAFFLGPPLSWHECLYVLAETKGALTLVVLDRAKGRLEWSQELALVEQDIAADLPRMLGGATPSISADEIIVCPTSGGAVVAVDLTTQSLLWAYRYARKTQGQPAASEDELAAAPRLDQFDRWLDATAAIVGESVILTPPESREIHCLDLKSGEARWTQPRGEGMFVGCLTGDALVVVGRRQVLALRLLDGASAWTRALPDKAFPSGRGVFAGERYFLPLTSAAVLEIDLSTGALAGEHKSPRELSTGNLIWHKGLFFSQGPAALEAFDERDGLVTQVRERLERNPHDFEALVRHGDLELASGRVAEAIAAFRTAHEADRSPRTKSKLVSALLQGVHQKLPDKDALSTELDGLIGP